METLTGRIQAVIYSNNSYAVIRVAASDGELLMAVGCVPFPAPGEEIDAKGNYVTHPVHGPQFSIETVKRKMPQTAQAIFEYLSSGVVSGIGAATAKLIVEKFGESSLDIIAHNPEKLAEIKGITPRRAEQITEAFSQKTAQRRLMELLVNNSLSPVFAPELFKQYGDLAQEQLIANPYILLREPFCCPFENTDKFAAACGIEETDPRRLRAGIIYELIYNSEHCYLPKDKLELATMELLGVDNLGDSLDCLVAKNHLVINNETKVYLADIFRAENGVAKFVGEVKSQKQKLPKDIEEILHKIEHELQMTYAPLQKKAVLTAAKYRFSILTGGPGTGKTTTVRAMLRMFDYMGLKTLLAAPTGRAAKRLSELTGREASTIHRLLEFGYDPSTDTMKFLRNGASPLKADVVVIDECSMVDIELAYSIVTALGQNTKLILIGDPDQLPAVGPGNFLRDLIEIVPTVCLSKIFRQAAKSRIITNAHAVNKGEMPDLVNSRNTDFSFLRRDDMQSALETVADLCAVRLPQNLQIPHEQIQVLSPTRKGSCGTSVLNKVLQNALNPPANNKLEKKFGEFLFREGDRVMQIRNNYDLEWQGKNENGRGVFNGEIGIIKEINNSASVMTVLFDDKICEYSFEQLGELESAFAMTVHKSQGSEYSVVVLVAMPGPLPLMTKGVLYTAITRARDRLIIVGQNKVLETMAANAKRRRRYSGLRAMVKDDDKGQASFEK